VPLLLAARQSQLDLGVWSLEVDAGGDQRQTAALRAADQPVDLVPVQEQLAWTLWVVVLVRGRRVGRDVGVAKPNLAALDHGIRVAKLGLALPQGLDLGSDQ